MKPPLAVCYAGFPGAGKSAAAEIGAEIVGGEAVSMGDYIRRFYEEDMGEDRDSHSLGEYATQFRKENGPEGLAKRMVEEWEQTGYPALPVHIDGLRCVEGYTQFESRFGEVPILFIEATFPTRLGRMTDRGREGEGGFNADDLARRDGREAEWGTPTLRDLPKADCIDNNHTVETLENRLGSSLLNVLGYRN